MKRKKSEPIDLTNPWFPPGLYFVPSAKAWAKLCADNGWDYPDYPLGEAWAHCATIKCDSGATVIALMLSEAADTGPLEEAFAALAHEVSHAADRLFEAIHEPTPSTEFRAHVVGGIFQAAAKAYMETRR